MPIKQLFHRIKFDRSVRILKKKGSYGEYAYNVLNRFRWSKAGDDDKLGNNLTTIGLETDNYDQTERDLSGYDYISGNLRLPGSGKLLNQLCNCTIGLFPQELE